MVSIRHVFNPVSSLSSAGGLERIGPEPESSLPLSFGGILSGVASLLSGGGAMSGLNPEYSALIQLQLETQRQMMLMSAYSNIEKSKHETQMAAVRNIRVG